VDLELKAPYLIFLFSFICIFIFIYIDIYIYIYSYVYIFIYIFICVYIYIFIYICIYLYVYIFMYIYLYIYSYVYISIYIVIFVCVCVCVYICICMLHTLMSKPELKVNIVLYNVNFIINITTNWVSYSSPPVHCGCSTCRPLVVSSWRRALLRLHPRVHSSVDFPSFL